MLPLSTGQILENRYKIIKVLGEGGFGTVYLSGDTRLFGKKWAIKEVKQAFPLDQIKKQVEMEVRLLSSLDHPSLPEVIDFFPVGNQYYIVMEYIEGEDLSSVVKKYRGLLPEKLIVRWAIEVAEVLSYIHSLKPHPVIIKDLKPENIIRTKKGCLKLIDFGIAREYTPSGKTMTHLRGFGTPGYAPPEQEVGGTTPLTDVFAFGRLLYFLVTKDDPQSRSLKIFQKGGNPYEFPPPSQLRSSLSGELERIIQKASQLSPKDRYQSAGEILAELKNIEKQINSGKIQSRKNPVKTTHSYGSRVKSRKSHKRNAPHSCFQCGFSNDFDAKYCNRCGSDMRKKRIRCRKCGKYCVRDAKFCTHCGKRLI